MREMCKAYNIGIATYIRRIERGSTVKEALTKPVRERNRNEK